ncbi:MAG: aminotransferase class III-fold pyridoxal phosphate-dependent enzyme [Agathobaculum butyriciproducens]|nr:aminotransferase class III-fold pyridoxal phosphate-dependent enzyme [Agathobaculum butyriciproducens]
MSDLKTRSEAVMPPMAQHNLPFGIDHAAGSYLYTDDGRKLLDFGSGIAVNNLGHNYPSVVAAAKAQLDQMVHCCHNLFYYEKETALAERLVGLMGGGYKVYFSNSGAEAVEGAVKLAKYATERPAVIAFKGSFHGRTLLCTSLTASNSAYRKHYEGLVPSIYFAEYPKLFGTPYKMEDGKCPKQYFTQFDEIFKKLVDPSSVAAILLEPVQGEGGYVVPPREWVQYVRKVCDKYGILLIFDEVQTGFGRTGKMFCWQNHGVKPDIMACAKGIANGLPLSAVVGRSDIMNKWTAGAHGGTFGANPVSCAAALATIDALEGGAIENGAKMGAYFMDALKQLQTQYPCIGDVRGLGLMIGMELVQPDGTPDRALTARITALALEKGLFLLSCGCDKNVVRFIAPLTVSRDEIDFAMGVLREAFAEATGV